MIVIFQNFVAYYRLTSNIAGNLFGKNWNAFSGSIWMLKDVKFEIYESKRAFDTTRFGACWHVKFLSEIEIYRIVQHAAK